MSTPVITNLTKIKIDDRFLEQVIKKATDVASIKKISDISIVLVDDKKIRQINKRYRGKNKPTDVLSFEGLNEIFICPGIVKKQAKKLDVPFKSELARVTIHGILHLAGYDHERGKKEAEMMAKLEEKILNNLT
ncbi:MAG: rRNA maturation RNase YbeY [bacterium]